MSTYTIGALAKLSGVTVRTLHHYDDIGLLAPSGRTDAGYRIYGEADLARLQQILVMRALGTPLAAIERALDEPGFDRLAALEAQRDALREQRGRIDAALLTVENTIAHLRGETEMKDEALFDGFDPSEDEEEARERWGETDAYRESARRTKGYTKDDWAAMKAEADALNTALAAAMEAGEASGSTTARALAERHRLHIDRWFYPCPHAMHAALGDMYVADERFSAQYERYGAGLAAWLRDAIHANAAAAAG